MKIVTAILTLYLYNAIPALSYTIKIDSLRHQLSIASPIDSMTIYEELGEILFQHERYDDALNVNFNLLNLATRLNSEDMIGDAYNSIGRIYYNREEFKLALDYYTNAIKHFRLANDEKKEGVVLNNVALVYYELDSLDEALAYYLSALDILKETNNQLILASISHNIALIYNVQEQHEKAITYLNESLYIFRSLNQERFMANTYNNLGRAYHKIDDDKLARLYFDSALTVAKKINASYIIMDNLRYQSDSYYKNGAYKDAIKFMNAHSNLRDSIFDLEKSKQLTETRTKYESEIKEQENVLLRKENEINEAIIRHQYIVGAAIISVVILLSIVTILLYYSYRQKRKANDLLSSQKREIENTNAKLEKLNKEISLQKSELESLNQIKDKLFSIISHEFRSPLNSLKGTLSLVLADAINLDELKTLSGDITDKINNTSIFLDNLLNWAKNQMQGIEARPEKFRLKDLVESNRQLLKSQAEKKKINISNNVDQEILVFADIEMINLVVRNLISNAIKFTRKNGDIKVFTSPNDHSVSLSVKDSGVGIPQNNLQKLFQLETETTVGTANEKGTGLGLMLSRSFVEMNGGDIWAESKEGEGSIISFSIPLN